MAEPTTHSEAPAGQNGFPPFQSQNYPSQLVWLTLTFILLYVIMAKVALPRIGAILAQRRRHIADEIAAAQRFKEQSDAAHAAYEKALADARARAQAIAGAMREKQAVAAAETNKRLEAQLHERLAAAEQSIAATRAAAMGNVGTIAADTAAAIVKRLIGKAPAEPEVAAAVGDALKRRGGANARS
jgi:F-type H+-transporting ATPase subunit b